VSLPVRGRGLKFVVSFVLTPLYKSLPVRGRGLKLEYGYVLPEHRRSLPVRGRGLKFKMIMAVVVALRVAPRAGAWIEIL